MLFLIGLILAGLIPIATSCLATPSMPMPVVPCLTCSTDTITYTTGPAGGKEFQEAIIYIDGGCNELELLCVGVDANVEFNFAMGVIRDTDPGQTLGQVRINLFCNDQGDWEFANFRGLPIVNVECSSL
ncbi:hypothetical protein PRIPAC_92720 [Pristionchus pacificus]|uniref:C6 domain-containing protein n=1 Tax=Pristionchus pacificus TaxID=54126 RepID=A0A2A6CHQ4_PRIPA|nr:hypothetical protein PRIPAC_92720 [Pristionchus pacificus]|eukprot:PDM77617.1 hypothetical protein PRIPAC_34484 [Pristionchus pacificus]